MQCLYVGFSEKVAPVNTNPIRVVLINRQWMVEDTTTGWIYGPFNTSNSAIAKMQKLRAGKTTEAAKQAVRRERQREKW